MIPQPDAKLPCPRCDGLDWRVERPSRVALIRRWFEWGQSSRRRPKARRCASCGFEEQIWTGGARLTAYRPARWSSVPTRLVRALLRRRSAIPAPRIYVLSGLTGAAIGSVVIAIFGWPWWAIAPFAGAAVLLTWLIFLGTMFTGARHPGSLRSDLLAVLDPRGGLRRHEQETERLIRSCPFPLFGLDGSWTGRRMLGGHGSSAEDLTTVDLSYGDPMDPEALTLRVSTSTDRQFWPGERVPGLGAFHREPPPDDLSPEELGIWMRRREDELNAREIRWMKLGVPVDGGTTTFEIAREGDEWIAAGEVDGLHVVVHGDRWEPATVRLERVADIEPYIEGSRRYREELRQRFGQNPTR